MQDWIQKHIQPAKGRKMIVQCLETTMNYVKLFADLGINISGQDIHAVNGIY